MGSRGARGIPEVHAAPLHSCKYRWLHAPATNHAPGGRRLASLKHAREEDTIVVPFSLDVRRNN